MKKIVLVLIVIAIIIAIAVVVVMKKKKSYTEPADFGKATMSSIDSGKMVLACDDAKILAKMIRDINKEFTDNPDLSKNLSEDNLTPAMKSFESAMSGFGAEVEKKFKDNTTQRDLVFASIGEGVSNVYQVALMSTLGMLKNEQVDEYVDVTYCGVKPKDGYVSPLSVDPATLLPPTAGDNASNVPAVPTK